MTVNMRRVRAIAIAISLTAATTGCAAAAPSNTANTANTATSAGRSANGNGHGETASLAYAGSLQLVNNVDVGPAFTKATGIAYNGRGGGAFGIAQLIRAGEITPNVFETIGVAPAKLLMPHFTDWAVGIASSPLVLVYSPQSRFAPQLRAIADGQKPMSDLFSLLETPGFHLGRTNPQTDPQGQAFLLLMQLTQQYYHLPAGTADRIVGSPDNPAQVFAEESVLSQVQAGALDASSAFLPQAIERHLPYIQFPAAVNFGNPADASLYAKATLKLANGQVVHGAPLEVYITALRGTPDTAAGAAFVAWQLSAPGLALYKQNGYTLTAPVVYPSASALPPAIRLALRRS